MAAQRGAKSKAKHPHEFAEQTRHLGGLVRDHDALPSGHGVIDILGEIVAFHAD